MGRFDNMSVHQAAIEVYGEELAAEFMGHFHRGSLAKAVLNDEAEFIDPNTTDEQQRRKILEYLADKVSLEQS